MRSTTKYASAVAAGILMLVGCATTGSSSRDASALNQISVGASKAQVIAVLGNPTSASAKGAGVECLDYKFRRVGESTYSSYEHDHFITLKNGKVTCYGEWSCQSIFSTFKEDYHQCM